MKLHDDLKRLDACSDAQEWASGYKTLSAAWANCERGDWMLWLISKTDTSKPWSEKRKPLVLCACEIARTALQYTKDTRALACIETTEAWCQGDATQGQMEGAVADAAHAAYVADVSEALRAAHAAYVADVAEALRAADAAHAAVLKQSAEIVRKHYPKPPRIAP